MWEIWIVTKEAEGMVAVDIWQTLLRSGKIVRQDDPRHSPSKKGGELAVSPTPTGAAVTHGIVAAPAQETRLH